MECSADLLIVAMGGGIGMLMAKAVYAERSVDGAMLVGCACGVIWTAIVVMLGWA